MFFGTNTRGDSRTFGEPVAGEYLPYLETTCRDLPRMLGEGAQPPLLGKRRLAKRSRQFSRIRGNSKMKVHPQMLLKTKGRF